jgi:hypothetical protein
LVRRVAELEIQIESSGQLPAARPSALALPAIEHLPGTALTDLVSQLNPTRDGDLPILIIGSADVETDLWRQYAATELADVCLGLPDRTSVYYVSAPVGPRGRDDLQALKDRYGVNAIQVECKGASLDPKIWLQAVSLMATSFAPRLVIVLKPDRQHLSIIPALKQLGCKVMVRCAQNELNDLIGTDFRAPLALQQDMIEAYSAASLVLASSHWEREQLDIASSQRVPSEIYVCGVDLEPFTAIERTPSPVTRVLFIADRSGPVGLKVFRDAAQDLVGVTGLALQIASAQPGRDTINLVHTLPPSPHERLALFANTDVLVVPLECGGFSQTLMEGLAAGCACLVPEASFGRYPEDSPFHAYKGRRGHLAEQITLLHSDIDYRHQMQTRSVHFAATSLAKHNWATWLSNCITWLSVDPA